MAKKSLKRKYVGFTKDVVDRTYGGRVCNPVGYTTYYFLQDASGKYMGVLTSDDYYLID